MATIQRSLTLYKFIKRENRCARCLLSSRLFCVLQPRHSSTKSPTATTSTVTTGTLPDTDRLEQIDYVNRSKELLERNVTEIKPNVDLSMSKGITVHHSKKETAHSALLRHCLNEQPNTQGFINAVDLYIGKNKKRHGHVEFIATAMKFIEPYGLEKDLNVYNKLIDVFPRDKFDNRTLFDAIWPKPHPQINLALDILTKMEWQGISPSEETHDLMYSIFGRASFPLQKIYGMWFWFETFKDINPYPLSDEVYRDRLNVIKAAIDRISENNTGTNIIELSPSIEVNDRLDYEHYVISSQSPYQQDCVERLSYDKPLYVEGPHHMWLNHVREEYFVLKTGREDLVSSEQFYIHEDEEREGVVLAVCFTSRPLKENLQKWIFTLQENNPNLKNINVVFNIKDDVGPDYSRPTLSSS